MSLADLVASVASATKSSAKSARAAIDAVFNAIEKRVTKGGSIRTPLGTFSLAKRGSRQGRNLITGEALTGILIAIPIVVSGRADVLAMPESLHFGQIVGLTCGFHTCSISGSCSACSASVG